LYEKANADFKKELQAVNKNWMESKKEISVLKVELKKCRSSSSEAISGQYKSAIAKLTRERDDYSQQFERSKSLREEMKKGEAELKNKKSFIKKLRKDIEIKSKEITSLNAILKRKERELAKAKFEVLSGLFSK